MDSLHYYTPRKAAEILKVAEEKVLDHIKSGRLKAQFLTNIMEYMITHEDLMAFLKEKKDFGTMKQVLTHRIILVDRDLKIQDVVKLELGRHNIQVRVGTTDREVGLLLDETLPDAVAIVLGALFRSVDPIQESIKKAQAARRPIILYHSIPEDILKGKQDVQAQIDALQPAAVVNISRNTAPLIEALKKAIGIK